MIAYKTDYYLIDEMKPEDRNPIEQHIHSYDDADFENSKKFIQSIIDIVDFVSSDK